MPPLPYSPRGTGILVLLTIGPLLVACDEVQVVYPIPLPTQTPPTLKTFTVQQEVSSSLPEAPVAPPQSSTSEVTTKTVFGYNDFITTVDNTVMVFTPDTSSIPGSPTSTLEELKEERSHQPFIEVQGGGEPQPQDIQPSRVPPPDQDAVQSQENEIDTSVELKEVKKGDIEVEEVEEKEKVLVEAKVEEDKLMDGRILMEGWMDLEEKEVKLMKKENVVAEDASVVFLKKAMQSSNTLKGRLRHGERHVASLSYKERLKERLQKEKVNLALQDLAVASRRSSSEEEDGGPARARIPRARSFQSRFDDIGNDKEEEVEQRSRSRSRSSQASREGREEGSFRPSSGRSRGSSFRSKIRDSIREQTSGVKETSRSFSVSKPSRNRFTPRDFQEEETTSKPVSIERSSKFEDTSKPKIVFKKFNRFDRPDRRALLRSKLFGNRNSLRRPIIGLKPEPKKKVEKQKAEYKDNIFVDDTESSPSALVISMVTDADSLQHLESNKKPFSNLQTTLLVSTIYPEGTPEEFLEVATIRSPYTFDIEENQKSTRFITVTRTNTKPAKIAPTSIFTTAFEPPIQPTFKPTIQSTFEPTVQPTFEPTIQPTFEPTIQQTFEPTISPTPSSTLKHTPLFDTASIPAPENILGSTAIDRNDLDIVDFSDIVLLPSLVLPSSLQLTTPPLETVTESFTTSEVIIKKSILPVIMGTDTSFLTLSQTFSITKMVTAIKTVPPMELYEFSPEHSFADFDNLFEEAGSENRESRLPGELEFSDQDNFGLEGPNLSKVVPPKNFQEDLDIAKQNIIFDAEKNTKPEEIQSSFQPTFQTTPAPSQGLDLAALGGLGITPEQLILLQLLQNPLAALGRANQAPQVVTESSPVYKTEPVVQSSVIQLFLGAKEFLTTLTSTVGFTTRTDYVLSTRTVGGSGGLPRSMGGLQTQTIRGLAGFLGQEPNIVTSAITRDVVVTMTNTEELRLIFRNRPTTTTLTSTTLVTSQVVSYVTQTISPPNPLAGFLG